MQFDYIIAGGGSAGCALAARLSADPTTRVLVLEAGRPDYIFDPFIHMPAALTFPIGALIFVWMQARSTIVTLWTGGITWRGTFYPLKELKRGVV